jgi:hypothetical protein
MVSAARRLGEVPTLAERLATLERVVAEQVAKIAALEARADADDQLDGSAPSPLPPNWIPIKAAAPVAGFSQSGFACGDQAA